jgi:hypothetical protein
MSTIANPKLVSKENATTIAGLEEDLISVVLRLSSLGLKPPAIVDYCQRVADGSPTGAPPVGGGPKPLVIQAYSFLSDHSICVSKYGMSVAAAAELLQTLRTDPDTAVTEIHRVVTDNLLARGSPRPVTVNLVGMPGAPGVQTVSGNDGGKSELSDLMRRHQALVGGYKFQPQELGAPGPERFVVFLGGNLAVVGQNKAVAEKAAKLIRVLGRHHPVLAKYVRLRIDGKSLRGADKIPTGVYDGILSPDSEPPVDQNRTESTVGR